MIKTRFFVILFGLVFFSVFAPQWGFSQTETEQSFTGKILVPESGFQDDPRGMMRTYLLEEIAKEKENWKTRYETLKSPEQVREYQQQRKVFFRKQLGKMWEKTPLNPKITKTLNKGTSGTDAYRIETILLESVPGFYISGAMFLPDETRFQPPYPGILVVCGHSNEGKEYPPYQQATALAAQHGFAALIIDPIEQGERIQRFDASGKPIALGTTAHNLLGFSSILLGRNTATFEVWDMIRALDYLQSREDVDPQRLGVMGNSGGGTQTSYIMALDDRVKVAVPCCYICGLYDQLTTQPGPQDAEQNIFGQLGFGMDHVDYLIMRAPAPTLVEATTLDFFPIEDTWKAFRNAKRIYDRFGFGENVSILEHDSPHGWDKTLREGAVRWFLRFLANREEPIFEPAEMPLCSPGELWAAPNGKTMEIEGARTTFDLNRDYNRELLARRVSQWSQKTPEQRRTAVREIIAARTLSEIPALECERKGEPDFVPPELHAIARMESILFRTEQGRIFLPAILLSPKNSSSETSGCEIYLNDAGKAADPGAWADSLKSGKTVLAVDLRGMGETQSVGANYFSHGQFGTDGTDFYLAYLLGKTHLAMRTEDLAALGSWMQKEISVSGETPITLRAEGEISGTIALHAAFLEPDLFSAAELKTEPRNWYDIVHDGLSPYPITNIVHGALEVYDLCDLKR